MRRVTTRGFPAWQHTIEGGAKPMNQLHTAREQRFIDMAGEMADDFAKRAAIHDEEGSFPFENYERLKESGYTRLIIPESLGGLGATMLERIKAQERLAQGCGATALAINMHFNTVGLLVDLHRKFKAPNVEQKLRRIAAEQPDMRRVRLGARQRDHRAAAAHAGAPGRWRMAGQRAQDIRHPECGNRSLLFRGDLRRRTARAHHNHLLHFSARYTGPQFQGRLACDGDAGDRVAQLRVEGRVRARRRRGAAAPGLQERTHHESVCEGAIHNRRAVHRNRRVRARFHGRVHARAARASRSKIR